MHQPINTLSKQPINRPFNLSINLSINPVINLPIIQATTNISTPTFIYQYPSLPHSLTSLILVVRAS